MFDLSSSIPVPDAEYGRADMSDSRVPTLLGTADTVTEISV